LFLAVTVLDEFSDKTNSSGCHAMKRTLL